VHQLITEQQYRKGSRTDYNKGVCALSVSLVSFSLRWTSLLSLSPGLAKSWVLNNTLGLFSDNCNFLGSEGENVQPQNSNAYNGW